MRINFPKEAESWLFPDLPQNILVIGKQIENYLHRLLVLGNCENKNSRFTVLLEQQSLAEKLMENFKKEFPSVQLNLVIGQKHKLPFSDNSFNRIYLSHDQINSLSNNALSEYARILENQGNLFLYTLARDDSVPWVKRLTKIIQEEIPDAMQPKAHQIPPNLENHPAVKEVQQRSFRIWTPCRLPELLQLLEKTVQNQNTLANLRVKVTDFYQRTAQPGEPLSLPYQLLIWQTIFSKKENSYSPENPLSQGLRIQLN